MSINRLLLRFILIFFLVVIGYAVFSPSGKNTTSLQSYHGTIHHHAKAGNFAPGRLDAHYLKHGYQFGSITEEDYLQDAQKLLDEDPSSDLLEKVNERGDIEHYRPSTHEFAVMASSGRIRTYFIANDRYWDKQHDVEE